MSDLFWPGEERAGDLMSDAALLRAMVHVEQAWLDALAGEGIATRTDLSTLVGEDDLAAISGEAERVGNPVVALVRRLRERGDNPWVHRGLTSQDVIDTALVLCLRDVLARVRAEQRGQSASLVGLVTTHRDTLMAARTLTQHAVPTTFGLKAATWLSGVLDGYDAARALRFPLQLGGAAGTLAAAVEVTGSTEAAGRSVAATAAALELDDAVPWHTARHPVTAIGDALVTAVDAWGRVATDVATLARPEIGELAEPTGRGGSSTMPQKQNPVLSVLIRRAAITAPSLAATLHTAAALSGDERPDGSWHAEWPTLRDLGRRTVVAGSQTSELLSGLRVDADRMATTARDSWSDLTAERDAVTSFAGRDPHLASDAYLGAHDRLIDRVLARAGRLQED